MKIFVDSANLLEIEEALERGFPSGITTNRGNTGGTLRRAKRRSPLPGSSTLTARLSERLEM